MRVWSISFLLLLVFMLFGCSPTTPKTPVETFKTYTRAIAKKDASAMRVLLSAATIRMHEKEAQAQNVPLDEILLRETLFTENQKSVEFKNEKIDGEKATLMVKNTSGSWEVVPFVREDDVWKIDKAGYADQMMKDIENQQKNVFDDLTNINAEPQTATEDNGH